MLRCFFDVDGVLLDFEGSYLKAVSHYFNLEIPEDYQTDSWFFKDLLTEEQMHEGWRYFLKSRHFEQMEPLVNPARFNDVFGAYPVHFVTNIPPDCLERRCGNLRNVGFAFASAHCGGFIAYKGHPSPTKAEVITALTEEGDSVLFVDDHPDNCLNVREAFPEAEVWLMSRSFNHEFDHPEVTRAQVWEAVFTRSRLLGTAPPRP